MDNRSNIGTSRTGQNLKEIAGAIIATFLHTIMWSHTLND